MEVRSDIIFIGGIHGVGKGTVCKEIASKTDYIHITASELLKWNEISIDNNKFVKNIISTQERLIIGLNRIIQKNVKYLLDGHFCLLDLNGLPSKISEDTFDKINPKIIVIVSGDIDKIAKRLKDRDAMIYDFDILNKLQQMEIEYAKYLSKKYSIPYVEIRNGDYTQLLKYI